MEVFNSEFSKIVSKYQAGYEQTINDVYDFLLDLAKHNNFEPYLLKRFEYVKNNIRIVEMHNSDDYIIIDGVDGLVKVMKPRIGASLAYPCRKPTIFLNLSYFEDKYDRFSNMGIQILAHELFHCFSSAYWDLKLNNQKLQEAKCGFSFRVDRTFSKFEGMNEGMTELLTEMFLHKTGEITSFDSYTVLVFFSKLLVGKDGLGSKFVKYYFANEFNPKIFGENRAKFENIQKDVCLSWRNNAEAVTQVSEDIVKLVANDSSNFNEDKRWYKEFFEDADFCEEEAVNETIFAFDVDKVLPDRAPTKNDGEGK